MTGLGLHHNVATVWTDYCMDRLLCGQTTVWTDYCVDRLKYVVNVFFVESAKQIMILKALTIKSIQTGKRNEKKWGEN